MKTITKVLIAALILYGLGPLTGAILCFFNPAKQAEWMHLGALTPDVEKVLQISGAMMLGQVILYFSAISLLVTGMKQGYMYAVTCGLIELVQGIAIVVALSGHSMGSRTDIFAIAKGALLFALALAAFKKTSAPATDIKTGI
jgi:membrane-associated HD superfamily phosphohydrolase